MWRVLEKSLWKSPPETRLRRTLKSRRNSPCGRCVGSVSDGAREAPARTRLFFFFEETKRDTREPKKKTTTTTTTTTTTRPACRGAASLSSRRALCIYIYRGGNTLCPLTRKETTTSFFFYRDSGAALDAAALSVSTRRYRLRILRSVLENGWRRASNRGYTIESVLEKPHLVRVRWNSPPSPNRGLETYRVTRNSKMQIDDL